MSEQDLIAESPSVDRQLPGAFLRQAREAQGLTLGEVSSTLKFTPRQIESLESDDFDQLQGKTFLRGFIRAYARLLKLDSEPLLAMLETETTLAADQVIPPDNMGETNPKPFYRRHGKMILTVIALAVALAAVSWFYPGQTAMTGKVIEAVPPVTTLQPATAIASAPPVAVATVDPLSAVAAISAIPAVSATVAQPVAPADALVFEFSALSWLEVKDADGQILLTGEFQAGQKQGTTGKPPYQLWIGKSSAVKVTYKGQPVDLQSYSRDEVARLTLDK